MGVVHISLTRGYRVLGGHFINTRLPWAWCAFRGDEVTLGGVHIAFTQGYRGRDTHFVNTRLPWQRDRRAYHFGVTLSEHAGYTRTWDQT